ncbi:MAG: 4Fe-4S dicluster domain-containing protein [Rhodoplanes sp.]|uniref:4Fe-4S dicluster domain-containing protein n=1 Tax=Rhodoplanes sp. TaxID=1968906 RepID=UPI00184E5225|nr:4Fe-4S dicluster domain-containing protein [Rhodoplanes sp.]NVO15252.1 4Fe-4S dicluster domain-containing protein [Rhodoplanes sp.]
MNRLIVSEPSKCIGCRTCEIACVLAHSKSNDVDAMSKKDFAPRLKLIRTLNISTPVTCHHCDDAPCLNACPAGAIVYRADTVQVDQERCIGCKTCVVACPFGAMDVISVPARRAFAGVQIANGMKAEAHKCDLCLGRDGGPACAEVCPTKALHVMDEAALETTRRLRQQRAAVEAATFGAVA